MGWFQKRRTFFYLFWYFYSFRFEINSVVLPIYPQFCSDGRYSVFLSLFADSVSVQNETEIVHPEFNQYDTICTLFSFYFSSKKKDEGSKQGPYLKNEKKHFIFFCSVLCFLLSLKKNQNEGKKERMWMVKCNCRKHASSHPLQTASSLHPLSHVMHRLSSITIRYSDF